MNIKHIQSFFLSAGNESCCALCLYDIAKEYCEETGTKLKAVNEQDALEKGIDCGAIYFNFKDYSDKKNFLVESPADFMKALTGKDWCYAHVPANYKPAKNEKIIEFWALSKENGLKGIGHFIKPGKNTLQRSKTVSQGFIYSKRVLRLV